MSPLPWFRMFHEARSDRKLETLSDRDFRLWFNLLCYAAEQKDRGTIPAMHDYLLAIEIGASGDDELYALIERLAQLRMVSREVTPCHDEMCNVTLTFLNFEVRNYDKPSDTPEQTRRRKAKQRVRERDIEHESRDVTPSHAVDKSREDKSRLTTPPLPPSPTQQNGAAAPPVVEPAGGYRSLLGDDWWGIVKEFKSVDAVLGNGWLEKGLKRAPPGLNDDELRDALENSLNRIADDFKRDDDEHFIAKRYGWAAKVLDEELSDAKGMAS